MTTVRKPRNAIWQAYFAVYDSDVHDAQFMYRKHKWVPFGVCLTLAYIGSIPHRVRFGHYYL